MKFVVRLTKVALEQIDEQVTWYESKQIGLGERFHRSALELVYLLETSPFAQVRYEDVRCIPIKGFPYMFHIGIDEEQRIVHIYALIHTARNPESNWGKDDWFVSEPVYYYGQVAL